MTEETVAAEAEAQAEGETPESPINELEKIDVPDQAQAPSGSSKDGEDEFAALMGISMTVQVVLGRCRIPISDLLALGRGSIVELDREIGESVDVLVNDKLIARGDLSKLPDGRVGVTLNEILQDSSLRKLK